MKETKLEKKLNKEFRTLGAILGVIVILELIIIVVILLK